MFSLFCRLFSHFDTQMFLELCKSLETVPLKKGQVLFSVGRSHSLFIFSHFIAPIHKCVFFTVIYFFRINGQLTAYPHARVYRTCDFAIFRYLDTKVSSLRQIVFTEYQKYLCERKSAYVYPFKSSFDLVTLRRKSNIVDCDCRDCIYMMHFYYLIYSLKCSKCFLYQLSHFGFLYPCNVLCQFSLSYQCFTGETSMSLSYLSLAAFTRPVAANELNAIFYARWPGRVGVHGAERLHPCLRQGSGWHPTPTERGTAWRNNPLTLIVLWRLNG